MTWPRFLIGWVVLACIVGPLVGRMLKARRLEMEAAEVWSKLPKLDQPDPTDRTAISFQRSNDWRNG